MRKLAAAAGLIVLLLTAAVAYWHGRPIAIALSDVIEVRLGAFPEGPAFPPFQQTETGLAHPLSEISKAIPIPLPHPAWQFWCSHGENLVISLRDGRSVTYGQCRRPASINHLIASMNEVLMNDACRPQCSAPGVPGGP